MSFAAIGSTLRANTTFGNGITLWGEGGKRVSPDLRLVDCGVDGNSTAPAVDGEAREIERRYRTLVEQLPLVIYVDALDEASSNIFTSGQIEPLLGYTVEEWRDDPDLFVRTLHPDDRDRVLAAHARTHRTHEPLSLEYRLIARDGSVVWVRDDGCVVLDDDGEPLYLQGYVLDITAERELQEQLRRQALFDPLTGLANRAFFHEQLEHAVSIRRENDLTTAVVFVDLDEFKQINDQHGHSVGDEVLAILGARLKSVIRRRRLGRAARRRRVRRAPHVGREAGRGGRRRGAPARADHRVRSTWPADTCRSLRASASRSAAAARSC